MNRPVRIALIGVGGIGRTHLAVIDELAAEKLVHLVAVADPAIERLGARKAELEARGTRWHTDYIEMLDHAEELDAVIIATPIPLHFEMAGECIRRGLFVHLEKPPVPLIQQLEELIEIDQASKVSIAFQHISSPALQELKRLVIGGSLGSLREIRATACWPRMDSYYERARWAGKMSLAHSPVFDGPATNALAHVLHSIMYLGGTGFEDFATPVEVRGELYRVRPIESYDTACFKGSFGSGAAFACAVTHATREAHPWKIEVRGSDGCAFLFENEAQLNGHEGPQFALSSFHNLFLKSHRDFIAFVQGRRTRPATTLRDARGFLLTTNGTLLSSGGIRNVDSALSRVYSDGSDHGYDLPALSHLIDQTYTEGTLFSDTDAVWAKKTDSVDVRNLRFTPFEQYQGVEGD